MAHSSHLGCLRMCGMFGMSRRMWETWVGMHMKVMQGCSTWQQQHADKVAAADKTAAATTTDKAAAAAAKAASDKVAADKAAADRQGGSSN